MLIKHLTSHYDEESRILYVDFGYDEPTYSDNIDDVLLIEKGWFTGLVRGFVILNI